MNSLVVYASRHGNTEEVANAIAEGLRRFGPVAVFGVDEAPAPIPAEIELVVIGGPTEAHAVTPAVVQYIERLGANGFAGKRVAAFDTRMRWPRFLSGSAAADINKKLKAAKGNVAAEPMSFFVSGKIPDLEPGELERAEGWAASLFVPAPAQITSTPVGS